MSILERYSLTSSQGLFGNTVASQSAGLFGAAQTSASTGFGAAGGLFGQAGAGFGSVGTQVRATGGKMGGKRRSDVTRVAASSSRAYLETKPGALVPPRPAPRPLAPALESLAPSLRSRWEPEPTPQHLVRAQLRRPFPALNLN